MGKITVSEEISLPPSPSAGLRSLYPKADGWYELTSGGVETKVFNANVYGENYQFSNGLFLDTNTLTTFKEYISIAYPSGLGIAGREYEIRFDSLTRNSTSSRNHISAVLIDSVILEEEVVVEHKDTGSDIRFPIGYTYVIDGSLLNNLGGVIGYNYRSEESGDTAMVHSCTLSIKRVI